MAVLPYTRAKLRTLLENKFLGMENEGDGDFEFEKANLDAFLSLALLRCFPALYKTDSARAITPTGYGTQLLGYIDPDDMAGTVYAVEDGVELQPVTGWTVRPDGRVMGLDTGSYTTFNVWWYEPYILPEADDEFVTFPIEFVPLVILGAVLEALESHHSTGLQDDPDVRYPGQHHEVSLMVQIQKRYDQLRADIAMAPPSVTL